MAGVYFWAHITSTPHMCRRDLIKSTRKCSYPCVRHEVVWGNVGIAPRISNFDFRLTWLVCFKTLPLPSSPPPSELTLVSVDQKVDGSHSRRLDGTENRTIFCLCWEPIQDCSCTISEQTTCDLCHCDRLLARYFDFAVNRHSTIFHIHIYVPSM